MSYIETNDRYSKSYKKCWEGDVLVEVKTACATATILRTVDFGETVLLDGEIQSTAADEGLYHAALTVPANCRAETACILGGGEGCTARNILNWPSIKRVDQVDYDKEFVQLCSKYLSHWTNCVYSDSRLHVEYNDAWVVIKEARRYDAICIDLIDFETDDFDRAAQLLVGATSWLNPGGSLTMFIALDSPRTVKFIEKLRQHVKTVFPGVCTAMYRRYIPSFAGEAYFIYLSKQVATHSYNEDTSLYCINHIVPACISTGIFMGDFH
jgi:spermidine synthase